MAYILGVDQGSTKTDAVICTPSGQIIGKARTAGSCHAIRGMEHAMAQVQSAAHKAMANAQVSDDQILLGYYGLTGADWPDEYPLLHDNVEKLGLTPRSIVNNDCWLSFRAGSMADYGIVVACGTGPNAAGVSPTGESYTFGYFADDGASDWLINRILKAVFWQEDGRGDATALTSIVLDMAQVPDTVTLLRALVENRLDRKSFQDLPRSLYEIAYRGDAIALGIIQEIACSVSRYIIALARRLGFFDLPFDAVLGGSLLKDPGDLLVATIKSEVLSVTPQTRIIQARYEPVVGAALYGLEEAGVRITPKIMDNIEASCRELDLIRFGNTEG